MDKYLATQIILGKMEYCAVIAKHVDLQTKIDAYLTEQGWKELIRKDCPVV